MKIVISIDISPKLLGVLNEDELQEKLKSRCLTLIKSYEKKWKEENANEPDALFTEDAEIDWIEMIQEGFDELKNSVEARVWGNT